ncbi:hypothetical protein RJ639_035589 [Escallonia herrerae]|uniref:Vesicle-fusing ATPase n=1 Tax=Escallonia herrerae TaxID=1293975 RepID=A0AA89B6B1_9ASTE|nr:hypothetical protein RJ639_035589 [Escallonia herrerae]
MAMTEISDDGASTADIFREGFSMDSLEEELMSMGIGATTASKLVKYFQLSFSARYPSVKHSRGLLLYGPQDDDKILIAQSILKIVKAKETLTLSGQEVMNDSQGYCWDKINSLCNAAREEEKRYGYRSGLYFVIVDEVDVIGKRREENGKFIYELFALMDNAEQLNNIYVIAMANHTQPIDPALLRHGRIDIWIKLESPNEQERGNEKQECTSAKSW